VRVSVGSDHAGLELKGLLAGHLAALRHEVVDLGTYTPESVDYPDFGAAVARSVAAGESDLGVCVCGTGIGISIAANKIDGARAAVVHDVTSARLAREHNNANVVCFGARLVGPAVATESLDAFLSSEFEGGRHLRRVEKISALEKNRTLDERRLLSPLEGANP